ncbi:MAG: NERD domain-containing protein/DEAD/DEAH box helicase, partial [Rhizobiaceae bacterium]
MARMYPNQLSDTVQSEAERVLYAKFRDDLDNSYVVFHGVTWQALDGNGRPRDGEADFIIAHPVRGVMVLEVKGGVIRCDPRRDYWTSEDKNGRIHTIKDPFYQARNSKYVLSDSLNAMLNMPNRRINIVDAVAFPDVDIVAQLPGLNKPREIVLDRGDLLNVSAWVGQCFAYGRGSDSQRDTAPGPEAVTALMNLLGKTWELRPVLWGDFRHEESQLIQLTQQQYTILDVLNRQRQVLICGCAGSGKTMLAIEKARRLAQQKFRVLFVCYNKSLARDLKRKLAQTEYLRIAHYHGLCYEMADQAGRMPTKPHDSQAQKRFFDQELPEALMDAADRLQHVRYDAIIVDEGQDFLEDWWIPLQTLLRDPDNGILYIFFDDNQRIYQRLNAFPIQSEPYV